MEGISDPLLLTERDGAPLIANASARALAQRLLGHEKAGGEDAPEGVPQDDAPLLAGLLDLMQAHLLRCDNAEHLCRIDVAVKILPRYLHIVRQKTGEQIEDFFKTF